MVRPGRLSRPPLSLWWRWPRWSAISEKGGGSSSTSPEFSRICARALRKGRGFERWGSQDKSVSGLWAGECCWVVVWVSWRIFQGLKPAPLVYPVRSKIGGAGQLFSDWGSGASVWVGETDPGDRVSCVFLSFVTFRVTVPLLKTTKPSFTG